MTDTRIEYISEQLDEETLLLQLAEECNELSAVIAKYFRKVHTYNPTPKTKEEIINDLYEEIADVKVSLDVVLNKFEVDDKFKLDRWCERLKENENYGVELSKSFKSKCPYCAGNLTLYIHPNRNVIGHLGYTLAVNCKGCAGHKEEFVTSVSDISTAKKRLLESYGIKENDT